MRALFLGLLLGLPVWAANPVIEIQTIDCESVSGDNGLEYVHFSVEDRKGEVILRNQTDYHGRKIVELPSEGLHTLRFQRTGYTSDAPFKIVSLLNNERIKMVMPFCPR